MFFSIKGKKSVILHHLFQVSLKMLKVSVVLVFHAPNLSDQPLNTVFIAYFPMFLSGL